MGKKIVIIGGVACGPKAAARARRRDAQAEITVIERQEYVSYASCGLPYYVGGVVPDLNKLLTMSYGAVRDAEFFQNAKDVKVLTGTIATAIDREKKSVRIKDLKSGQEHDLPYDQLVIATGAEPKKPPIPGLELQNVFNLWTVPDAVAIRDQIEAGAIDRACVIGAGLIGLEAAEALMNQAVDTTIIELMPHAMFGQLDPEMAGLLADVLRESKVALFCGETVKEIRGENGKAVMVVTDCREIETDAVLVSAGAGPNVGLAKACGLEIGETGAIKVDAGMRTSDPDIFAGGDCVENVHLVTGKKVWVPLGSTANHQGRVIGNNLTGGNDSFPGVLGTGIMKALSTNVGFTGLSETRARQLGYDTVSGLGPFNDKSHYFPGGKSIAIKVVADNKTGKVLGAQVVGPGDAARIVDSAAAAIRFGATVDDLGYMDFAYAPPFGVPIEPLSQTTNIIRNKRDGLAIGTTVKEFLDQLAGKDDFTILDIRNPTEFKNVPVVDDPRVLTIELSDVRRELEKIPRDKPVIVICQVGLRSFDVQCALTGNGFNDVSFLEGGMSVYLRLK